MHEPTLPAGLALIALGLVAPAAAQSPAHVFDDLEDSFAALGDVDGDGRPDLALGQFGYGSNVGRVEVRSGASGASLFTLLGATPDDDFARALACVGDLDGDGRNDFAVSTPEGATPHVSVHSGANGSLLRTLPASVPGLFGRVLAAGGDVDGDGVSELLIAAPVPLSNSGVALLVSLASGGTLRVHQGVGAIYGMTFLGDVDGDAHDDYALGVSSTGSPGFLGVVEVISGASGAVLYSVMGDSPDAGFGGMLASCGDLDGDGVRELLAGVPYEIAPNQHGALHVHSGATGLLLRHHVAFLPGTWNYFGLSVSAMGDQNGDGVEDYAALSPVQITCDICKFPGRIFFFDGATGAPGEAWHPGIASYGPISSAGDLNLDGRADVIYAAIGTNEFGATRILLAGASAPQAYCTAKLTSAGCLPALAGEGAASLSVGSGAQFQASSLPPALPGLLLWSKGAASLPFAQGTLCIAPPAFRVPAPTSPGSGACDGQAHAGLSPAALNASGFSAGDTLHAQVWARDPGFTTPNDVALTGGLHLPVLP